MTKKFKLNALALAVGMGASSLACAGTIVAPYFFTWGFGSGAYKFKNLSEAKSRAGMDAMTLAFAVSGGGCSIGGGMEATLNDASVKADVKAYINGGGRVILSFGGAAGTYLESVCSANDLVALIRRLMDTHGTHMIDWDIEGGQLGDTRLNGVRNAAIKQLQGIYPDLYTSFTLPVNPFRASSEPGGLPDSAVALVRGAAQAGVNVSMVNIMAMDYGSYYSGGKKMGDLAVSAAQSTFNQLKGIYPSKTDAQLWAMIGITPMIGQNDEASEIFTPADALTVTNFVKQKGVGLIAYWAAQRDRVGSGSLNEYSRANTRDYEYYQTFAAAKSSTAPPPPPPPAPPPPTETKTYQVRSAFSALCLDVEGASTANGAKTRQSVCSTAVSQQFSFVPDASGTFRIVNVNSGKSLDVTDVSTANGALIQQWTSAGTDNQRFAVTADGNVVAIQAKNSNKCLDVKDWNSAAGARVQQWDCAGSANQRWVLVPVTAAPAPAPSPAPAPAPAPSPAPAPAPSCAVWTEGKTYQVGTVVIDQGKPYKALVTHTAYAGAGWNPAATASLWQAVASCN